MNKYEVLFSSLAFLNEEVKISYDSDENISSWLLGEFLINRMGGVAYYKLKDTKFFEMSRKEFQIALECIYKDYIVRSKRYINNLEHLGDIFQSAELPHAFLKGAFLTTKLYPVGLRISNDIDILINQDNISECQSLLKQNGFIQGLYKNGSIVPATRHEILNSRMNFGETIPWVKIIDDKPVLLDINFSVDYKANQEFDIVKSLLGNTIKFKSNDCSINTLNEVDFLIHLCCHLYKEATTYDWLVINRDTDLYKFCDIYTFLNHYANYEYFEILLKRITELGVDRECYYSIYNTTEIFKCLKNIPELEALLSKLRFENTEFMNQICWPSKSIIYKYDIEFTQWVFCKKKVQHLIKIEG